VSFKEPARGLCFSIDEYLDAVGPHGPYLDSKRASLDVNDFPWLRGELGGFTRVQPFRHRNRARPKCNGRDR
jgi:hypothetical protein